LVRTRSSPHPTPNGANYDGDGPPPPKREMEKGRRVGEAQPHTTDNAKETIKRLHKTTAREGRSSVRRAAERSGGLQAKNGKKRRGRGGCDEKRGGGGAEGGGGAQRVRWRPYRGVSGDLVVQVKGGQPNNHQTNLTTQPIFHIAVREKRIVNCGRPAVPRQPPRAPS